MAVITNWRCRHWHEREAKKTGILLEELGLPPDTYFRLRNRGIDTIAELIDFLRIKDNATPVRLSLPFHQLHKINRAISVSKLVELTEIKHKILQNKVEKYFRDIRRTDEAFISYKKAKEESLSTLSDTSISLLRSLK
ncbi:MAG: hypothetical protein HWQ38_07965 [Nostoc sp. NMS7]|uniref:hypothetical protein n=1 Tax=Nostoc sp. NMS7 TaxID=2815391 RepID=UPI0025D8774F|nr:hypothetical protein [Nostoc sp. NMS7]MBN3946417.1 hypothetical protein [Nostoc sp. NMS7]